MLTETQESISDLFLPVLSGFSGSVSDHFGVNSARHTVVQLRVELRKDIKRVDWGLGDIPDGSSFNDVPNHKLADSFVLGTGFAAVGTTDVLDMATAVLGASIILPLLGHLEIYTPVRPAKIVDSYLTSLLKIWNNDEKI